MIVPRNKLLGWFALIAPPFALLAAVEPAAAAVSFVFIGGLVVAALADALGARGRLAGISLTLPGIVRLSKDREGTLEVRVRNGSQQPRLLRVALGLPPEIQSPQETVAVELPPDREWSRFSWTCRPLQRGHFRMDAAHLEAASALGFWNVRGTAALRTDLRVYPNLLPDRRRLAALFLRRGALGLHAQRQVGKGREFEKLREYVPGDGFDEIHWKATARRGRPITKVFQIERTQEVYVLVDASRLSARVVEAPGRRLPTLHSGMRELGENPPPEVLGAQSSTTLERFITAALVLGLAAEQQGDLFGLLTFSNQMGTFIRARNGKAHYGACRDALYTLQPQIVSPDFDELCGFLRLRLRRRALLVFLTSLDDPVLAESFVKSLDLIRRQHLVLVNMLQPPGVGELFSQPEPATVDGLYQHLGGHLLWRNLRELEKVLQRRGVRFSLLGDEKFCVELVAQYLRVKRRQLL